MGGGFFGHTEIVKVLTTSLPQVSLFLGPISVGKWELAEHVRKIHGVRAGDVLRVKRLTQENAKFVEQFAHSAPQGEYRLCIIRLRKASDKALNTLLKTLEESDSAKFILIAEDRPLPTIVSRSEVFSFGLLSQEEVQGILTHVKNFAPGPAGTRAALSGGQVLPALVYTKTQDSKTVVLRALEALASNDAKLLEEIAPKWQDEHTELLTTWCYESLTSRWRLFTEAETRIRGTSFPLKILMALRSNLRPRLVVRHSLASLLTQ